MTNLFSTDYDLSSTFSPIIDYNQSTTSGSGRLDEIADERMIDFIFGIILFCDNYSVLLFTRYTRLKIETTVCIYRQGKWSLSSRLCWLAKMEGRAWTNLSSFLQRWWLNWTRKWTLSFCGMLTLDASYCCQRAFRYSNRTSVGKPSPARHNHALSSGSLKRGRLLL